METTNLAGRLRHPNSGTTPKKREELSKEQDTPQEAFLMNQSGARGL